MSVQDERAYWTPSILSDLPNIFGSVDPKLHAYLPLSNERLNAISNVFGCANIQFALNMQIQNVLRGFE